MQHYANYVDRSEREGIHLVISGSESDASHFIRVYRQTILAICLDHGQRLQVVDLMRSMTRFSTKESGFGSGYFCFHG